MPWIWDGGGNWGLTNHSLHGNIYMSGRTRGFLLPNRRREPYHQIIVNIAPRRHTTSESSANRPDNRWHRVLRGVMLFTPTKSNGPGRCYEHLRSLITRKEWLSND
jgi:hypothetical protein